MGPMEVEDKTGGIPAKNSKGERLLVYMGIIDILQSYRLAKKLEHSWKALVHDGDTVSVHRPSFYADRFQKFMCNTVFKKMAGKTSPAKKRRAVGHIPLRKVPVLLTQASSESRSDAELVSGIQPGQPDLLPKALLNINNTIKASEHALSVSTENMASPQKEASSADHIKAHPEPLEENLGSISLNDLLPQVTT